MNRLAMVSSLALNGVNVIDWMSVAGLLLTVVAMAQAIKQGRMAKVQLLRAEEQTEKLERQGEALEFVAASLTTRYLGPFPDFYANVLDVLRNAQKEIYILNSNPVPALISRPSIYVEYTHILAIRAQAGVKIHVTCPTEARRKARLQSEFPTSEEAWAPWKSENMELVRPFVERRMPGCRFDDVSGEDFIDALVVAQNASYEENYRRHGISIGECDEMLPVQAWIVDGREAVFSIQRMNGSMAHALYTSDPMFVEALTAMLQMYWIQPHTSETRLSRDLQSNEDN